MKNNKNDQEAQALDFTVLTYLTGGALSHAGAAVFSGSLQGGRMYELFNEDSANIAYFSVGFTNPSISLASATRGTPIFAKTSRLLHVAASSGSAQDLRVSGSGNFSVYLIRSST